MGTRNTNYNPDVTSSCSISLTGPIYFPHDQLRGTDPRLIGCHPTVLKLAFCSIGFNGTRAMSTGLSSLVDTWSIAGYQDLQDLERGFDCWLCFLRYSHSCLHSFPEFIVLLRPRATYRQTRRLVPPLWWDMSIEYFLIQIVDLDFQGLISENISNVLSLKCYTLSLSQASLQD